MKISVINLFKRISGSDKIRQSLPAILRQAQDDPQHFKSQKTSGQSTNPTNHGSDKIPRPYTPSSPARSE